MRNALFLLAVPGTSAVLAAILSLSAVAERRLLSPRSLILGAARARRSTPEFTEAFVARQFERLLREASATPGPRPRAGALKRRRGTPTD